MTLKALEWRCSQGCAGCLGSVQGDQRLGGWQMSIRFGVLLAALVALPATGYAQERVWGRDDNQSARWLVDVCASEHSEDRLVCYHYLRGFRDGVFLSSYRLDSKPDICWPDGVSLEQMRRMIVRQGETHPEELHDDVSVFAYMAFRRPFACSRT